VHKGDAIQAARQEWRDAQATREATRLVCIDETWAAPNLTRRYGRAPRGARRVAYAPHGHWKPTTVVAAWRHTGIAAPRVVADPINGALCLKEVQECLGPALAPGDSVMLDHLSAHPGAGVNEAIAAAGATGHDRPPDAPGLNPSEPVFSTRKALLRQAATRTVEAVWTALGPLLDGFTAIACQHDLHHSGYCVLNKKMVQPFPRVPTPVVSMV
jgi:DDE superfamily endonuclease